SGPRPAAVVGSGAGPGTRPRPGPQVPAQPSVPDPPRSWKADVASTSHRPSRRTTGIGEVVFSSPLRVRKSATTVTRPSPSSSTSIERTSARTASSSSSSGSRFASHSSTSIDLSPGKSSGTSTTSMSASQSPSARASTMRVTASSGLSGPPPSSPDSRRYAPTPTTASTATATTTSAVLLPLGGAGGTAPPGPGGGAGGLPSGWEPFGTGPGGAGGCRDTDPSCLNSSVRCPSRDAVRPPWSVTGGGRARARPGPRARSAERVLAVAAVVRVQAAAAGHGVLLEGAADVGRPVEVVARDHVAVVAVLGVRLERRVVVDLGVVERRRRRRPGLDVVARHPDVGQVGHVWQVGQVDVGFDRRAAGEVDQPLAVAPDELEVVGPRLA